MVIPRNTILYWIFSDSLIEVTCPIHDSRGARVKLHLQHLCVAIPCPIFYVHCRLPAGAGAGAGAGCRLHFITLSDNSISRFGRTP